MRIRKGENTKKYESICVTYSLYWPMRHIYLSYLWRIYIKYKIVEYGENITYIAYLNTMYEEYHTVATTAPKYAFIFIYLMIIIIIYMPTAQYPM